MLFIRRLKALYDIRPKADEIELIERQLKKNSKSKRPYHYHTHSTLFGLEVGCVRFREVVDGVCGLSAVNFFNITHILLVKMNEWMNG